MVMNLFDLRTFGIAILFLLGMLVTVKRVTMGSFFDKPQGYLMVQLVKIFNPILSIHNQELSDEIHNSPQ